MTMVCSYLCRPDPAALNVFQFTKYIRRDPDDINVFYAIVISQRSFRSIENK